METTDTDLTKSLKQQIVEDLGQHYTDKEFIEILDIASFLDPRFKVKYLEKVDDVLAVIKEEGASIVCETQVSHTSTDAADDSVMNVPEQPTRKKMKLGTLFKVYDEDVEEGPQQISPEQIFNTELENYLSLPKLDAEEEILPWWKLYSTKFPFISQLAQR